MVKLRRDSRRWQQNQNSMSSPRLHMADPMVCHLAAGIQHEGVKPDICDSLLWQPSVRERNTNKINFDNNCIQADEADGEQCF